jgi:hypothetical protein
VTKEDQMAAKKSSPKQGAAKPGQKTPFSRSKLKMIQRMLGNLAPPQP